MTLNRFFSLFLLISFVIYFGISPYVIDQKRLQDIPQLEFESFTSYEIEGENVNFIINGQSAKRYDDKVVFSDFVLHEESNNSISSVAAQSGLFKGKEIILSDTVQYQSREGIVLETQKAVYHTKYKTLDIKTNFRMQRNNSVITGSSLFFNQNNDKIEAKDVKASLNLQ